MKKELLQWTDDEIEKLRELANKYHYHKIADILGRNKSSVYSKAKSLGIKLITTEEKTLTEEQGQYVIDNLNTMSVREISINLKVNRRQIIKYMEKLGINYISDRWTEDEVQTLKKLVKTCHYSEIARILNRTPASIMSKIHKLGLESVAIIDYRRFTEEEKQFVKDNWDTMTRKDIAIALNCTVGIIAGIKKELNLPDKGQNIKWDKDAIDLLKKLSTTMVAKDIAKHFRVSTQAVYRIANLNQIKLLDSRSLIWTEELNEKLKTLAQTNTADQVSKILNKSYTQVTNQARKLGINFVKAKNNLSNKKENKWSKEDTSRLIELFDSHTIFEIAIILKRTENSVKFKATQLGLDVESKSKNRRWTKEDEEILTNMYGTYPIEKISETLNRTIGAINRKVHLMQLGSVIANNYDGLTVQELANLFKVSRETIQINWVVLGLKIKEKQISSHKKYSIIEISDLLNFLEQNQDIWDSRILKKNIFGKEPNWLTEKRKKDDSSDQPIKYTTITKAKLIAAKNYFLELNADRNNNEPEEYTTDTQNNFVKIILPNNNN